LEVDASMQDATQRKYRHVPGWGRLPPGISFAADATSVAVDKDDNVYVFNRGNVPVVVFDSEGNYLAGWGRRDDFELPHGITVDIDGFVYLVDTERHSVEKYTAEGDLKMRLGGTPSGPMSGKPFHQPTDVAVHPSGDIFVSDGYGNPRIHRFDNKGRLIRSWGTPGTGPGEFAVPHSVCFLDESTIAVCDRENYRIQLFTIDGEFVDQWPAFRPASAQPLDLSGRVLAVAEFSPPKRVLIFPGVGHKVCLQSVVHHGLPIARFAAEMPPGMDAFMHPHSIAVDTTGAIYVAETVTSMARELDLNLPADRELVSLRKWIASASDPRPPP
jgi:sugar lactone lactonase YvrE